MARDIAVPNKLALTSMVHYATLNLCEPEPGGTNLRRCRCLELFRSATNNGFGYYLQIAGAPHEFRTLLAETFASCRDEPIDPADIMPPDAGRSAKPSTID